MRLSKAIIRPILTEKSMALQADNKYVFKVNTKSSKGAIKNEIKRLYDVEVEEINTMVMPGKKRRIIGTRRFTKTKRWKKAVVRLKEGQNIEFAGSK
jgi:large subunit ribosomal protein L23